MPKRKNKRQVTGSSRKPQTITSTASSPYPAATHTEVEAYDFIRQDLRDLKWIVKNPSLGTGGHVWTQNQCLSHPGIKQALGTMRPENIVKVSEKFLWVIEAKSTRKELSKAIDEAIDDYAKKINETPGALRAIFASGVAGNESSGYLIKTKIRIDGKWIPVTINGQEATGLLSPESVKFLIENNTSDIHDYAPPQYLFLKAAERINAYLHIGGINKNDRAKTMAALLLSVLDEPPNLDTSLPVLIGEINARSKAKLKENGKPDFFEFVKIIAPTNTTNHVKYKSALILTIQELLKLNIRSAMNSRTDVLGQFYEVFLKYGNGAKEIGIVLTPRHVTRFAVEAIGVSYKDVVLDVACGTGGFLVAAFDHVRRTATASQLETFKEHGLFGIEQESAVAMLAIVNMIFRGDGKNNIVEGNCFSTHLTSHTVNHHPTAIFSDTPPASGTEAVTRVLMNPPFALRGSTDQEYRFVSAALSSMVDGSGILFSLLPLGAMFREGDEYVWRKDDLLAQNTLLAVISLPERLFIPAANKQVLAIVVKKGYPHPKTQPVFWARVSHDGHLVVKSRRLPATDFDPPRPEPNHLDMLLPNLRAFVAAPGTLAVNEPEFCKTAPIDFSDPLLELIPEAYLDGRTPTTAELREAVDDIARETVSYLVKFRREGKADEFAGAR
ncbi:MAG: HsdM family class I SAM-dependent methyltransferase [Terriglobia bacterium]